MIKSQVGRRYSKAIFEIAEEKNQVKEIYEMLNSAMVLYRTDKEFKNFILNPLIDNEQKKSVLNEIFAVVRLQRASDGRLLAILLCRKRQRFVHALLLNRPIEPRNQRAAR